MQLKADLDAGYTLENLADKEYIGEFDFATDPIGSPKPNPVSHIAYGYATQLFIIDQEGKVVKVVAAHDVGRVINPLSATGQVEGGIAMGLGYALTEDFPLKDGIPQAKLGTLGLFKSSQMPPVEVQLVEKNDPNGVAFGAKGVGEIVCCMGAPACQNAYYKKDGIFRYNFPLDNTYYRKPKPVKIAEQAAPKVDDAANLAVKKMERCLTLEEQIQAAIAKIAEKDPEEAKKKALAIRAALENKFANTPYSRK
jgi:hypothetical protein